MTIIASNDLNHENSDNLIKWFKLAQSVRQSIPAILVYAILCQSMPESIPISILDYEFVGSKSLITGVANRLLISMFG